MSDETPVPDGVDPTVPSPARLYDAYLGGTANFEVDRAAAESIRRRMPELGDAAWANRGFLQRAAGWLAERGVRQFLDLGAGLPTQNNTHEVVQRIDPAARVVYVDNDQQVVTHAKSLLGGTANVAVLQGDLRAPREVLESVRLSGLIDVREPVGVLVVAVAHFVSDEEDPWAAVQGFMRGVTPGSYLALSHITADNQPDGPVQAIYDVYAQGTTQIYLRPKAAVSRFFAGLELVPPYLGSDAEVTYVGDWGADDPSTADSDGSRWSYAGVARKS